MNINKEALLKHLLAGLLVGGGAGSAIMLGRQLSSLNKRVKEQTSTARDDDTIKLTLKQPDGLEKMASGDSLSAAASYLALLAGAAAGFQGVKKLSESYRKKQLQREIDKAQQLYMTLGQDQLALKRGKPPEFGVVKTASAEHNAFARVAGVPLALGGLIALASAVLTNKFLNEQYPRPLDPASTRPKELDLRITRAPDTVEATEILTKQAMVHPLSTVSDVVYAVAQGRGEELREAVDTYGWDHAFNLTKNASHNKVSNLDKNLAVVALASDPLLQPGIAKLAAAEYADMSPGFTKLAQYIEPDIAEDLQNIACTFNMHVRSKTFEPLSKSAGQGIRILGDRWLPRVVVADAAMEALEERRKAQKFKPEEEAKEDVATLKLSEEDLQVLEALYGSPLNAES